MRRLVLPLALAALLALAGLVVVQLLQPAQSLTPVEQARQLAGELRCPDCQSLSVAESRTAAVSSNETTPTMRRSATIAPNPRPSFVPSRRLAMKDVMVLPNGVVEVGSVRIRRAVRDPRAPGG